MESVTTRTSEIENFQANKSLPTLQVSVSICDMGGAISTTDNILLYISLFLSVVFAVLYGFIQTRNRKLCGYERPSIVIPVNLLQSTPERWVYVLMFGAISGELLVSILSNGFGFTDLANSSVVGSTLNTIFVMFLISFAYFPAFASVRAPIPILGYCIGVFHCSILFTSSYVRISKGIQHCLNSSTTNSQLVGIIVLVSLLPLSLSHLSVIIWFVWKIGYESYRLCSSKKPKSEALFELPIENHSRNRVKWLLSKWIVDPSQTGLGHAEAIVNSKEGKYRRTMYLWFYKFYKSLYRYDPHIHFPLRFLAAIVIMVYIVFILTLTATTLILVYVLPLVDSVEDVSDEVLTAAQFLEDANFNNSVNLSQIILTVYDITRSSIYGAAVVMPTGPLFSFLTCMVLLLHMMGSVHIHLKKIAKGDYDFLPKKIASPAYRLVHSMQFIGFQVGYFTWAWILLTASVWLAGLLGLIVYFLLKFFLGMTIGIGIALLLPILYSFALYYVQLIFTKLFFVGDTGNKHVVINNIRLFQWFSYVMVFQNAVVGITSAFIRILYSILFGVLLLFRLDRVVLMKGFERFDKGHKSYIGFLYLEHTLNNPILRVFSELLLEGQQKREAKEERAFRDKALPLELTMKEDWIDQSEENKIYPRHSQQALNRWMVCYTLLQNPSLCQFTASQLQAKKNKQKESKVIPVSSSHPGSPCLSKSEEARAQEDQQDGETRKCVDTSDNTLGAMSHEYQLTLIND